MPVNSLFGGTEATHSVPSGYQTESNTSTVTWISTWTNPPRFRSFAIHISVFDGLSVDRGGFWTFTVLVGSDLIAN